MKRYLVCFAAAGAAFAGSLAFAAPASAAPPHDPGCPPGFFLDQLPDPRLGDPNAPGTESFDVNGDHLTCVRLIATDANGTGTRFAAVDNASMVP